MVRLRGTCHDLALRLDIFVELVPASGSNASSATINQLQLHVSGFVQLEIGTLIDQCVELDPGRADRRRCCQRLALSHLLAGLDSYARLCERRREVIAKLSSTFATLAHPHEAGIIFRNERCVVDDASRLTSVAWPSWCCRSPSRLHDFRTTTTTSSRSARRSYACYRACRRQVCVRALLSALTRPVTVDDSTAAMLASIPAAFIDLLREGRPLVDAVSFFVLSMFDASLRRSS